MRDEEKKMKGNQQQKQEIQAAGQREILEAVQEILPKKLR